MATPRVDLIVEKIQFEVLTHMMDFCSSPAVVLPLNVNGINMHGATNRQKDIRLWRSSFIWTVIGVDPIRCSEVKIQGNAGLPIATLSSYVFTQRVPSYALYKVCVLCDLFDTKT